ncbi:MAG: mechanosensitive ion channel family protein [Thermoplasmata archaeon]|nr:mechanosensitive ion channel family protein [Thermoplasmata archaeon]
MAAGEPATPDLKLGSRLVAVILAGVGAYAVIALVDHFFPLLNPLEHQALQAGAILLVGYFAARLFGSAIRTYLQFVGNLTHGTAVRFLVNILVAMIVVAALLHVFNVSLGNLLLSSAFAGIVIGLAAQTVLANVFAGLLIVLATPFRVGDRIGIISANYGAFAPSYPHEVTYPTYSGTVRAIGLSYTDMRLDNGRLAKIPNQVLLTALVLNLSYPSPRGFRIRLTLDQKVPVTRLEEALAEYVKLHAPIPGYPEPHVEVADVGSTTWDGVIVLWSNEASEEPIRDAVLRRVLPKLAAPSK